MSRLVSIVLFVSFCNTISLAQAEWKFKKESEGIKAYIRPIDDYSIAEYKVTAEIDGRVKDIIALMKEESSYQRLFTDISHLEFFKNEDDRLEMYLVNRAPFPARDRDGYFISLFSYDHSTKTVRVDLDCPSDVHNVKNRHIRITRCKGHWEFKELSEKKIGVEHQFVADPGGFVPAFILNIFLVNNPISTIKRMREEVKDLPYSNHYFKFMAASPTDTINH